MLRVGAYICKDATTLALIIQDYAAGQIDLDKVIIDVYMCPKVLVDNIDWDATPFNAQWSGQTTPVVYSKLISKPTTINNYTPVNKKLLTFPYCFLNVSNNNGTNNTYQYELFNEYDEDPGKCIFNMKGVPVIRWFN